MTTDPQVEVVRSFWRWFAANTQRLKSLYSSSQFESLAGEMNREIDKIEPQLAWELGAGKLRPCMMTISAEGNTNLRQVADLMVALAPKLADWEFYSSRPARPAPRAVQLPESGQSFDTSEWEFVPIERPERGRLDLVVVDDQLARSDRESSLRAVSLYLDQVLGEDTVESWVGKFSVESRVAAHGMKSYKMAELPNYLLWVTHRETDPLRRISGRLQ